MQTSVINSLGDTVDHDIIINVQYSFSCLFNLNICENTFGANWQIGKREREREREREQAKQQSRITRITHIANFATKSCGGGSLREY